MSFTPISGGLSSALSGSIEPTKLLLSSRNDIRDLSDRRIHSPESNKQSHIMYTILIIIISALIFVTIIAIYDVIRNAINNYYAAISLDDPNSHNNPQDIERTKIANQNALWSSMVFAAICIVSAFILIVIFIQFV